MLLFVLVIEVLACSVLASSDVAYVYRNKNKVDDNIVNVFEDKGLDVELIDENDIRSVDFSDYKLIFVGDERFRKFDDFAVYKYPVIISNYYFGEEWGLTDHDGISKLAANQPMSVNINSKVEQVYTQARFNGISIPYYYLSNENRVMGIEEVATPYTRDEDDLGAVIGYANPGTYLTNGKVTGGKLCFYGIIESDYWTNEAREMFEDCVGFVGVRCEKDSDCPKKEKGEPYCIGDKIYRDVKEYECENKGTLESECVDDVVEDLIETCEFGCSKGECEDAKECEDGIDNEGDGLVDVQDPGCWDDIADPNTYNPDLDDELRAGVRCSQNSDCGVDGFVGDKFCQEENIFQKYVEYACLNPGLGISSCKSDEIDKLKEQCKFGCDEAIDSCLPECEKDSDCEQGFKCVDSFCTETECNDNLDNDGDDLIDSADPGCWDDITDPNTYNPDLDDESRATSECQDGVDNDGDDLVDKNDPGCWDSPDNPLSYNPKLDDESRATSECQDGVDNDGDDLVDSADPGCWNDITNPNTYNPILDDESRAECYVDGQCEPEEICINGKCVEIECERDSDCNDGNVYTKDVCVNPGELSSYCTNRPIECIFSSDCGTNGFENQLFCSNNNVFDNFVVHECNNPGEVDSYCSQSKDPVLIESCSDTCFNGECIVIQCSSDLECGTDGYVGERFCKNNNVYQDYKEFDCLNPGTGDSLCSSNEEEVLIETCDDLCIKGKCMEIECERDDDCDDGDVYTYDKCNIPGTPQSYCSNNVVNCVTNSDCGITGFITDNYCFLNKVFSNFQESTCKKPGTLESHCEVLIYPLLLSDCGGDYCDNFGDNYCKDGDVYHSRACYERGCEQGTCSTSNPILDEEIVENCRFGCFHGACLISDCVDEDFDGYDTCNPGEIGDDNKPKDCDDSDFFVNPGVQEVCNGKDDDCDSNIDEGFNLGKICSVGVGECANSGFKVCSADGLSSECNVVPGLPSDEVCDLKDNDCDGFVDESLTNPTTCGVGVCFGNIGVETCSNGVWGGDTCDPFEGASEEVCDPGMLDEDCDGQVNEGCGCINGQTEQCGTSDVGECQLGIATCINGQFGTCVGYINPVDEVCNGLDDDCDGLSDEIFDLGEVCSVGVGECARQGVRVCSVDKLSSVCNVVAGQPSDEVCDLKDNDCDGLTDEGGVCVTECDDGIDNDNDDLVDAQDPGCWDDINNPLSYNPDLDDESRASIECFQDSDCGQDEWLGGPYCGLGDNVYQVFKDYTCLNPGLGSSSCDLSIGPVLKEECAFGCDNGVCLESNCVDEDLDDYDTCSPGEIGDDGKPEDCDDSDADVNPGADEVCNGVDDDCDGVTDEGGVCLTECQDGIDNDNDDLIDSADPGCWDNPDNPLSYNPDLDDESRATTQCQDGLDNDGDQLVDAQDPGCWDNPNNPLTYNPTDNDETDSAPIVPECKDGKDNDGDLMIDALVLDTSISDLLFSIDGPFNLRNQYNIIAPSKGYVSVSNVGAFNLDARTAQKLCETFGYNKVELYACASANYGGRCWYSSCGDNLLAYWDDSVGGFVQINACSAGNRWLGYLSCSQPVGKTGACNNGIDDDNDGLIDLNDPGCYNIQDTSEITHDPECSSPEDNTEHIKECDPLASFTFNNAVEVRAFVNTFPQYNYVPTAWHNAGALRNDEVTREKICELKGYDSVNGYTQFSWHSPGNNHVAWWDEGIDNFRVVYPSSGNNYLIDNLVCSKTNC